MQKENIPLVSVVTLNWNTTEITCEFLRSIKQHGSYPNIEVIVVDNGSKEDGTSAFHSAYPDVKVIRTGKNLGFSGGNNVGLKEAKGDYLFFVNNDTEFTPGLLEGLLQIFKDYPDAGMVSPKFHYYFRL
jgi:GT2 family glycosyltransferase